MTNEEYKWDFNLAAGIPVGQGPKGRDMAGPDWARRLYGTISQIRRNIEALWKFNANRVSKGEYSYTFSKPLTYYKFGNITKGVIEIAKKPEMLGDVVGVVFDYYNPLVGHDTGARKGRVENLDEYKTIFQTLAEPEIASLERSDEAFGYSFVGGQNPLKVEKCLMSLDELKQMGFDEARVSERIHFKLGIGTVNAGASGGLQQLMQKQKLFFARYNEFLAKDLENGTHPDGSEKFLHSPVILFGSTNSPNGLMPLAIKLDMRTPNSPVIYQFDDPRNGNITQNVPQLNAWNMAKIVAMAAHSQYHEILAHLCFTHLVMETIVVGTRRKLPLDHPIHVMLNAHFEGTMNINHLAVTKLIKPENYVDRMVATKYESTVAIVSRERDNYNFMDHLFPTWLRKNGTFDTTTLPFYPVRDFGIVLKFG
jgi:arachidonate 15-lipoxygenase